MSANSGAWGIAMWKDGADGAQAGGISLEGGDPVIPFLPTEPLGCLTLPPDGLGVPPVRSGDVAFAQRDGVVQFADYYESRILTFQVVICNEGCPGCPSARQRVARLTEEWSRNCDGASLVIFSDCHNPEATDQEKTYLGPYIVHGRPRVAELTWQRSNRGCASLTLRFDAEDARLRLVVDSDLDEFWSSTHTVDTDTNLNLYENYRLEGLTMTLNGATVEDSDVPNGGPDDGSYFSRFILAPNTTSPMTMALTPSGTGAQPVVAGTQYFLSAWARKDLAGGPDARIDWTWYNGAGSVLTSNLGTAFVAGDDWERWSQDLGVAPVGAAFLQPRLSWTGVALVNQRLDFAQAWLNAGAAATEPETVEVVGNLCAFPTIRLSGELTAPIIVNYGPAEFTYNEDIPVLTDVTIDTRWGRAAEITVDTTQHVSGNYTQPLGPGVHEVLLRSADPSDTGSMRIEWDNAVVSG